LAPLSVTRLPDLVGEFSRESDDKHSQDVPVSSLRVDVCLNERLPLSDHLAQLVPCDVKPVETGLTVTALNVVDYEAHLAPCELVGLTLQVGQGGFNDTAFDDIGGDFYWVVKDIYVLCPADLLTRVLPNEPLLKGTGARKSNHSLRVNGSICFFF